MSLENGFILFLVAIFLIAGIFHTKKDFKYWFPLICLVGFCGFGWYLIGEIYNYADEISLIVEK